MTSPRRQRRAVVSFPQREAPRHGSAHPGPLVRDGFVQELFLDRQDLDGQNRRFSIPGKQARFGPDESVELDCDNPRPYLRCLDPPQVFGIDLSRSIVDIAYHGELSDRASE